MLGDDASAIASTSRHCRSTSWRATSITQLPALNNGLRPRLLGSPRELDGGREDAAGTHFAQASAFVSCALPLARECDHIDFVATCLNTLSLARRHSGDLDGCMAALREQLVISEQLVGHRMRAVCRATLPTPCCSATATVTLLRRCNC